MEERESENSVFKNVKCFSSEASETNIAFQEKQGPVESEFSTRSVCEKGEVLKGCEVVLSGNIDFVEGGQSFSSGFCLEVVQENPFVEDSDRSLDTSCVNFDENDSERNLGNKKEVCLVEPVAESMTSTRTYDMKLTYSENKREIMGKEEFDNSQWVVDGRHGAVEIPYIYGKGNVCEEMHKLAEHESEKAEGLRENGETTECPLKVEVIDETALIETNPDCNPVISNAKGKSLVSFAKGSERDICLNVMKRETDGKKEKRPRRRGKCAKKLLGTDVKENIATCMAEVQNEYEKKSGEAKRAYSREEMEAMRFVDLEAQMTKWIEVYCGLAPTVAKEYNILIEFNDQKHNGVDFDPRTQFRKKGADAVVLGEDCSQVTDFENKNAIPFHPASGLSVTGGDDNTVVDVEYSQEDDSDDDYSSIQRPALLVTGEPDFDSGPPQDGFEYLRRVRWEAAHIPKVRVAKLDKSKLNKEQTVYMPKIPDIPKCPEHLMPLKEWEDAFIADFSELRLALSRLEGSRAELSAKLLVSSTVHQEESASQLSESVLVEEFDNLTTNGAETYEPVDTTAPKTSSDDPLFFSSNDENYASLSLKDSNPKSFTTGNCDSPTLSAILAMDSVARLSMLRKRIKSAENMNALSRNDCVWLFALCAAIDTPLDADTCAALRCLLRKCASLRAEKSELDDNEVVMLNVLATITGKYFGQSEC